MHGPHRFRLTINQSLSLALLIALVPVAVYSVWTSADRRAEAQDDTAIRLTRHARAAAAEQFDNFKPLRRTLDQLAAINTLGDDDGECRKILARALAGQQSAINLIRVGARAEIQCAARPTAERVDVSVQNWWPAVQRSTGLMISAPVTRAPIGYAGIPVALAVRAADGSFDGAIVATVDHSRIERMLRRTRLVAESHVALVDQRGQVIAESSPAAAADFALEQVPNVLRRTTDAVGIEWTYAVAPVQDLPLHVVYAEPTDRLMHVVRQGWLSSLVTPLALLALTLLVLWIAVNWLVLRWLDPLRAVAMRGAGNTESPVGDFANAPHELATFAADLASMRRDIDAHSAEQLASAENSLKMAKEVHHRVRNNLQLISSLVGLQLATTASEEGRAPLRQFQGRVAALALVYRLMYDDHSAAEQGMVRGETLFRELCKHLHRDAASAGLAALDCSVSPVMMPVDVAVPLASIVVEAVTNAFRHGQRDGAECRVTVDLAPRAREWRLCISDNGIGFDVADPHAKLGLQLIEINAQQLSGRYTLALEPGGGCRIEVNFPSTQLPFPQP